MVAELTAGDSPLAETELKDANFGPEYNIDKGYDDNLEKSEIISGKQEKLT